MRHLFTNNAVSTLASGVDADDTTLALATGGGALFASPTNGDVQYVTLTNPSAPGVYEIAEVTSRSGDTLTVSRGVEGTAEIWGAGTQVSARVTAGMLSRFAQNQANNGGGLAIGESRVKFAGSSGVAINANSRDVSGAWLIGGYPVLQATQEPNGFAMSPVMSVEAVNGTFSVDLGVVPAWATATAYVHGSVVRPATPDGYQYRLDIMDATVPSLTSAGAEPTFPAAVNGTVEFGDVDGVGQWVGADLAAGVQQTVFPGNVRFYPDEIGFICDGYGAISAAPYVSIGTSAAPTLFANNVQLSQITAANMRHRFTSLATNGVEDLLFTLETPAVGGVFHGRFYFRGTFVEVPVTP